MLQRAQGLVLIPFLVSCAASPPPGPTPVRPSPPAPVAVSAPQNPAAVKRAGREPAAFPALAGLGADVTADFDVPEGLEVRVWATSPQFFNPTNIDIDARGRVWVTEGVNYRRPQRSSQEGDGYLYHPQGDRVMVLQDTNNDGAADKSSVFVQDKDLTSPLGVALLGDRVMVSSSPSVFSYKDSDGDGRSDGREVFLKGFGGFDHDHGVHSFKAGPDGQLYFNTGNEGPHEVKDAAGFTLRKLDDALRPDAPRSDDGRTWIQGIVLRIGADGKGMRVLAHNFRNNYEMALDSFGTIFQNDNDDDGNESCRFTYVMEGGNYGYHSRYGNRNWYVDRRSEQAKPTAHWHQEDPGVVPPTEVTGSGSPTGLVIYEGAALPARFVGAALNADAGRSVVWAHILAPDGAGYKTIERVDFLKSKSSLGDRARWFRPSDVAVGPDGAVYVADWYDAVVGGHAMLDGVGGGRILRIAPRGFVSQVPAHDVGTTAGQLIALASPAVNVRYLGWQALHAQGDKATPDLAKVFNNPREDRRQRARVLWLLAAAGPAGLQQATKALNDKDSDLRITALRALRQNASSLLPHLTKLSRDPSAAVRREVAVALRDVPADAALPVLIQLASGYDGKDRVYLEALGVGAEGKEDALWAKLSAGKSRNPLLWRKNFVDLTWRLHPLAAVPALQTRATAKTLSPAERERALVAMAFVPHADAVKAVLSIAENKDPALTLTSTLAMSLALRRSEAEWKSYGVAEHIRELAGAAEKPKTDPKIEAMKAAFGQPGAKQVELGQELALSRDGGMFLLGLAAGKKLTPEVSQAVAEVIFRNPDLSVRALASKHFARPALEGATFPPVTELLEMKGDKTRGREIFFGPTAACASCHEWGGKGRNVGPALTNISEKLPRAALYDSILNPSAGIAFGYQPYVVVTKDETTYTGFIVADGETLVMKDAAGETRFIPAAQIAERQRQSLSLMPDNIALGMKPQDLVDLVEFLATTSGAASAAQKNKKKVLQ